MYIEHVLLNFLRLWKKRDLFLLGIFLILRDETALAGKLPHGHSYENEIFTFKHSIQVDTNNAWLRK